MTLTTFTQEATSAALYQQGILTERYDDGSAMQTTSFALEHQAALENAKLRSA